jgi:hypothetical protein
MFSTHELRQLARAGALAQATRIVTEFPDILPDLNALAAGPRRRVLVAVDESGTNGDRPRRTMSAAARQRIGRAQRARWRKFKQEHAAKEAR